MALAPLATPADVEARGVAVDPADVGTLTTFLDVASAAIREAAGCPISQTTSTVDIESSGGWWLHLPAHPVTAVTSVLIDGSPVTDFRLISDMLFRRAKWGCGIPEIVTVTYTYGLPEVPADIVDMTCRLALAGLIASKGSADGSDLAADRIWQERIGDYYVMYRQDGSGVSEIEIPDGLSAKLRARFGGGAGLLRSR